MDIAETAQANENDLPIACKLTQAEREARGDRVTEDIFSRCEQVDELPDGYAFKFPGGDDWAARLLGFVLEERQCCPFFTFDLVFEPGQRAIWLHLRGSADIKAFVAGGFLPAAGTAALTGEMRRNQGGRCWPRSWKSGRGWRFGRGGSKGD